ncbi:MAG: hypothetical protein UEE32_03515 [Oscillospiraceae bacterium]|nr:hypothetical protein [Oscillospiraceae bacterium]
MNSQETTEEKLHRLRWQRAELNKKLARHPTPELRAQLQAIAEELCRTEQQYYGTAPVSGPYGEFLAAIQQAISAGAAVNAAADAVARGMNDAVGWSADPIYRTMTLGEFAALGQIANTVTALHQLDAAADCFQDALDEIQLPEDLQEKTGVSDLPDLWLEVPDFIDIPMSVLYKAPDLLFPLREQVHEILEILQSMEQITRRAQGRQ